MSFKVVTWVYMDKALETIVMWPKPSNIRPMRWSSKDQIGVISYHCGLVVTFRGQILLLVIYITHIYVHNNHEEICSLISFSGWPPNIGMLGFFLYFWIFSFITPLLLATEVQNIKSSNRISWAGNLIQSCRWFTFCPLTPG